MRRASTIPLVLTQPDRPAGRGMKLQASPVKRSPWSMAWPVAQPRSLRLDGKYPDDAAGRASRHRRSARRRDGGGRLWPDPAAVGAGCAAACGCLNIHASLLPRWRGAAPIHRAIEAGDRRDRRHHHADGCRARHRRHAAGRIRCHRGLRHHRVPARQAGGAGRPAGGARRWNWRPAAACGRCSSPQAGVTYAHKIEKAEAAVDWSQPAEVIARRIRAFDPFPGRQQRAGRRDAQAMVRAGHGGAADAPAPAGTILAVSARRPWTCAAARACCA